MRGVAISRRAFLAGSGLIWLAISLVLLSSVELRAYMGDDVDFHRLGESDYQHPSYEEEDYLVIGSYEEFYDFWNGGDYPPYNGFLEPPYVDFERDVVIVALWGLAPYPGYYVEIRKITEFDEKVVAYVEKRPPDRTQGGFLCVVTFPKDMVAMARTDKPIEFEVREVRTTLGLTTAQWGVVGLLAAQGACFLAYMEGPRRREPIHRDAPQFGRLE